MTLAEGRQQFRTGHLRHPHVAQDDVEGSGVATFLEQPQRFGARLGRGDRVLLPQGQLQSAQQLGLVVDTQESGLLAHANTAPTPRLATSHRSTAASNPGIEPIQMRPAEVSCVGAALRDQARRLDRLPSGQRRVDVDRWQIVRARHQEDELRRQAPDRQQIAPQLGVGYPEELAFRIDQRPIVVEGVVVRRPESVGKERRLEEEADVDEQAAELGRCRLRGTGERTGHGARRRRSFTECGGIDAGDRVGRFQGAEHPREEHELRDRRQADANDRRVEVGAASTPRERRVRPLQELRGDRRVGPDERGDIPDRHIGIGEEVLQLQIERRGCRERIGPRDGSRDGRIGQNVPVPNRVGQRAGQFIAIARLREPAVGHRYGLDDELPFGFTREHVADRVRIAVANVAQQPDAVRSRHPHVGDHHIDRFLFEQFHGLRGPNGEMEPIGPAQPPEPASETGEDALLVVDEEHGRRLADHVGRRRGGHAADASVAPLCR